MKQTPHTKTTTKINDRAMAYGAPAATDPDPSGAYQIRIRGHLGREWADWFGSLTITLEEGGDTLLTGPVADQAALHGLLKKVRNLGVTLLSVNRLETAMPPPPGPNQTIVDRSSQADLLERSQPAEE